MRNFARSNFNYNCADGKTKKQTKVGEKKEKSNENFQSRGDCKLHIKRTCNNN